MIRILGIIISLVLGVTGIVIQVKYFRVLRQILYGAETSRRQNIITAVSIGTGLSICFFALELLMANLSRDHVWTIESVLVMVALPAFGGLIVIMGTLWRIFVISKYRGLIYRKYGKEKSAEEKHQ